MKIEHAFTYQYETKHFGKMLEHSPTKKGSCFENVINYCKLYKSLGRNTSVSLVVGLRSWEEHCTMGYHYLVRDDDTLEYSDPQYSSYTFVELHNWTLEDYEQECKEYEEAFGEQHCDEFFQWYCSIGFGKALESAVKLIKNLAGYRIKLTDKEIKERFREGYYGNAPKYGKQAIQHLNVD